MQEKLQKIKVRCEELLAIAEKRTVGEWEAANGAVWDNDAERASNEICEFAKDENAYFIASCAGPAEAGWRATISAIEGWMFILDNTKTQDLQTLARGNLYAIIHAWPDELLK